MKTDTPQSALAFWSASLQQRSFRQLLNAFSYPGRIERISDEVASLENPALRLLLATLVDGEVTLCDPHDQLTPLDWTRLEARRAKVDTAQFIALIGSKPVDFSPTLGTLESPERGATLIIGVDRFGEGMKLTMQGPGIDGSERVQVAGLSPEWLIQRKAWNAAYPLGVDIILHDQSHFMAIPRTTTLQF
ncbi:MAG: phosphonate C-P lyase system protein PhnH [Opitutales bacterium]